MKDEKGYMTIEATISLTVFLFMMMFMMNFGQIYRAQNYVNHNLYQAGKMTAFYSYDYANRTFTEDVFTALKSLFGFSAGVEGQWVAQQLMDRKEPDYGGAVKAAFLNIDPNIEEVLHAYGILEGVNISAKRGDSDLDITADYNIRLMFRFFGIESIAMHQEIKCGLWS